MVKLSQSLDDKVIAAIKGNLGKAGEVLSSRWLAGSRGDGSGPGHDLAVEFRLDRGSVAARGQIWELRAIVKPQVYPRQARLAVWDLQRARTSSESGIPVYPLLIASFISPSVAAICEEAQVGYLDLAGNCNLEFGGIWFHVDSAKRVQQEPRRQRSLFSPKASRVLRVLLEGPLRAHKVEDLARAADVSLGLVSKVRTFLLDEELATGDKDGIRISKPGVILRDWILEDDFRKRVETREYSLLEQDHGKIAPILHGGLGDVNHAFTRWTAAHLRQPHVPPQVTSLYVGCFPPDEALKELLGARRVEGGGRLQLHKPSDEGVFIGGQVVEGLPLVSDLQIFLDLLESGDRLRADEAARELRGRKDFNGGWES